MKILTKLKESCAQVLLQCRHRWFSSYIHIRYYSVLSCLFARADCTLLQSHILTHTHKSQQKPIQEYVCLISAHTIKAIYINTDLTTTKYSQTYTNREKSQKMAKDREVRDQKTTMALLETISRRFWNKNSLYLYVQYFIGIFVWAVVFSSRCQNLLNSHPNMTCCKTHQLAKYINIYTHQNPSRYMAVTDA